jgi:hypothetical protein
VHCLGLFVYTFFKIKKLKCLGNIRICACSEAALLKECNTEEQLSVGRFFFCEQKDSM